MTGKRPYKGVINALLDYVPVQAEGYVWGLINQVMAVPIRSPISFSWYSAFVARHSSNLTPMNTWRVLLKGQGAARRGRPKSTERILNLGLRGMGIATPWDALMTFGTMVGFGLVYEYWTKGKAPTTDSGNSNSNVPPPDPNDLVDVGGGNDSGDPSDGGLPPTPKGPKFGFRHRTQPTVRVTRRPSPSHFRFGRRMHRDRLYLGNRIRELARRALRAMGMSRQGAIDLVDGRPVYGRDAEIYRQICDMVFIVCDSCHQIAGIPHAQLVHAVIYLPEDKVLLSFCTQCGAFTSVKVSVFAAHQLIHLEPNLDAPISL